MGNKSYLILSGVLLLSILFWSACNNPGSSLEESVKPYLELQAVDGASNVTMTVNRGAAKGLDSYFAVDFTNFDSNGIVSEGLKEGWCLDYQRAIDQNNDVHEGIKMFNTFGSENWKPANYLMNIKDELKQNDPSITYKEIQVALWSLIEKPSFNIDKALSEGTMPSRLMTNGSPNFSIEKTKGIINKVRNEVDDFVYKIGTPVIVYSNTAHDDQDVGYVSGETAWAFVPKDDGSVDLSPAGKSLEFCGENGLGIQKWGWTNGPFSNNILVNGDFSDALNSWEPYVAGIAGVDATVAETNDEASITGISGAGSTVWHVQLNQILTAEQISSLEVGESYTISFDARSSVDGRPVDIFFGQNEDPFTEVNRTSFTINTTMDSYSTTFVVGETFSAMKLGFEMGLSNEDVFIDNVVMSKEVSSATFDIYAGAGSCDLSNGTYVGTFEFDYYRDGNGDGKFDYTLDLTVDNDYTELHLYVGSTELPLDNNNSFTAAPGQFPYNVTIPSGIGVTSATLSETFQGDIYIAVHLGPLEEE